jgi:hypothetical protein
MGFDEAAFGEADFGNASVFGNANFNFGDANAVAPVASSAASSSSVDLSDVMSQYLDESLQ